MRKVPLVALALCASVFAACGGAGDSIKFVAPQKFGDSKNMFGMMQIWTTPNQKEVLILMKLPVSADPKKALQGSTMKDATVEKQADIKICNGQTAKYISMVKPKDHQRIDAILSPLGGSTYMAMYGYPEGSKPDPQAESAIRDLCAK